jgi:hypothetical protein
LKTKVTTNEGVLVFNNLGKQFTDILMAQNIKFFIIKRKWYKKILGYRSCKWWKASIASIFYLFMFFSGVAMIFGEDTTEAEKTKVTSTTENSKSEADRSADEQKKKDEEEAARLAEEKRQQEEAAKQQAAQNVFYANCTEVREAGAAPIYEGQPGYSTKLDRDRDGIACDQ